MLCELSYKHPYKGNHFQNCNSVIYMASPELLFKVLSQIIFLSYSHFFPKTLGASTEHNNIGRKAIISSDFFSMEGLEPDFQRFTQVHNLKLFEV